MTPTHTFPEKLQMTAVSFFTSAKYFSIIPHKIEPGEEYIEIITKGRIVWDEDGKEYGPGYIFWHVGGDHTIHITPRDDPYECLVFRFDTGITARQVPHITLWDDIEAIRELTDDALRWYHDESYDKQLMGRYLYYRLRWITQNATRRSVISQYPSAVRRAMEYIHSNIGKPLSIRQISQKVRISEPYLYSLFQKHLGVSPHQYVLDQRLKKARRMLAGTDMPIKEIAIQCGFSGIENFYRAFGSRHETTPGEYRTRHQPYKTG